MEHVKLIVAGIVGIVCLLIAPGCTKRKVETIAFKNELIKINVSKRSDRYLSDAVVSINIQSINDPRQLLMGKPNQIVFLDSKLVLIDNSFSKQLYILDSTLTIMHSISNKGNGPELYTDILAADADSEAIYVLDFNKILKFDLQGNFVKENRIHYFHDGLFLHNGIAYIYSLREQDLGNFRVFQLDDNFELKSGAIPFPNYRNRFPLEPVRPIIKNKNTTYFTDCLNDTIYSINQLNEVNKHFLFAFDESSVGSLPFSELNDLKEIFSVTQQEKLISWEYPIITDQFILFFLIKENNVSLKAYDFQNHKNLVSNTNDVFLNSLLMSVMMEKGNAHGQKVYSVFERELLEELIENIEQPNQNNSKIEYESYLQISDKLENDKSDYFLLCVELR